MPRVPAEWETQEAVWITWPSASWWKDSQSEALSAFAELAAQISRFEKVRINCPAARNAEVLKAVGARTAAELENVELFDHLTNDAWCRDSGAIFFCAENGKLAALDLKYNAWGGKFPPWDLDDALAAKMARAVGAERVDGRELTCEGGGLEFDGEGSMMTTECVVLNPTRNEISKEAAEKFFFEKLGVRKVIWLTDGLFNDDTDGHIDNLARFAPEGKILAAVCGEDNPSYAQLCENLEVLKSARGADGRRFGIIPLPLPEEPVFSKYYDGSLRRLPASYNNFLPVNGAVLMPAYIQKSDDFAAEILRTAFPKREIVKIDSRTFLKEGGAVHCLTQQQPKI